MFALKFAFKNIISRKSSLVIVLFIAFSIALLVMANAVFDGTRTGIEKTFSSNFTGDLVIRPKAQFPMSLFGDETPITGELSELPQLIPYADIYDYLKKSPLVEKAVPQITGQAALRINHSYIIAGMTVPGFLTVPGYFFGVDGDDYVDLMKGIKIVEGAPYLDGEDAVMLSINMVEKIKEEYNAELHVGDEIQMASFTGTSYSLRAARLAAIYEYSVHNDLQDKIILISPEILRQLVGLGTTEIDPALFTEENSSLLETVEGGDIDDLFGDGSDFESDNFVYNEIAPLESSYDLQEEIVSSEQAKETIWNYIVCSVPKGIAPRFAIKILNKEFAKREWQIQAIDWRTAAGMAAQYIYWMRLIFNIGLIVIIATGYIIVNNTLVIAALDRTTEIGALRAIGAARRFIAIEYLFETLMLTITAGIIGCILGVVGNSILSNGNVTFSNTYLIQLFGGETLRTVVSSSNIFSGMVLSFILAIVAWVYPVRIALNTSPVAAMEAVR